MSNRFTFLIAALCTFWSIFAATPITAQTITTVAGGSVGDGRPATSALLYRPGAVANDGTGNVYIADPEHHRVRKVNAAGIISTIAGNGFPGTGGDGGLAVNASLYSPWAIAVDGSGNVYVLDSTRRVRKIDATGMIGTVIGQSSLVQPTAIGLDAAGNLYVFDRLMSSIYKVSAEGVISIFSRFSIVDSASGLAVDSAGNVYVADYFGSQIHKVTSTNIVSVVAGFGGAGFAGDGGQARFAKLNRPSGLAFDAAGNLYIGDSFNARIRKVNPAGVISTVAGSGAWEFSGDEGLATAAGLKEPSAVTADSAGNLYIADMDNNRIRKVDPTGVISTFAGNGQGKFGGDGGPATDATLDNPGAVNVDAQGNIFFYDVQNLRLRKVDSLGNITTVAGNGTPGFSGDGGPAANAMLRSVNGIATDTAGNVFLSVWEDARIRRISPNGTIDTIAGTGAEGFSGDGGPAINAQIRYPEGIAVNGANGLYFADAGNARVRRITSQGIIGTVAGNGVEGSGGNGWAATATDVHPYEIAFDTAGNLYFSESDEHRIRKVDLHGVINTIAGTGVSEDSGDGGPARMAGVNSPHGLALDFANNLYIAQDCVIRKVSSEGIISTLAGGSYACGFGGDGGAAIDARFGWVYHIAIDPEENLVFTDSRNNRVRKIIFDRVPNAFQFNSQSSVQPGSIRISNSILVSGTDSDATISVANGQYSIGCTGTFKSAAGAIAPGKSVCVRHTASSTLGSSVATTLTIGGVQSIFLSQTSLSVGAGSRSDFNADGRSDILWHNSATGSLYELQMSGFAPGASAIIDQRADLNWKVAAIADLNGDGMSDVIWQHAATGQVVGLLMNGTTISAEGTIYIEPDMNWKIVGAGDFNGDGKADVLWKNSATGDVFMLLMNGLTVTSGGVIYSEPNQNWVIQKVADFNGDGKADIVWRNVATGDVFMMLMNGTTVAGGGVIYSEPNQNWQIQAAADFDGDGRADILWRNIATGDVFMMLMNGTTVIGGSVFYAEPDAAWKIVASGDYNGDGRADMLWRNAASGQVYMMLMNGVAITSGNFVYSEPDQNWKILGP